MASEGTCQQMEAGLVIPEEVTAVLEEIVMKVSTGNAGRSTDISVLHDYALEHLFSFLPMADLKNCRLVNRSWNRASNRAILKRDYVIHFEDYDGDRRQNVYRIEDISKLAQQIRTGFQFPWNKFKVQSHYRTMTSAQETPQLLLGNLLRVISPFVTELQILHLRRLPNLEYPNLRKLVLWYDSPESVPTGFNWTSILRMVEMATKLNEIAITGFMFIKKAALFMDILEIPNCLKITRLYLGLWIKGEHLARISKMGFQLKLLSLDFELTEVTTESVRAVLESQSNFLEQLALICRDDVFLLDEDDRVDPRWLTGMEFPRMEKLKVLYVLTDNLYSRISYKDMFPVLKKLTVDGIVVYSNGNTAVDYSFFNDDIEPVETVEYLCFGEEPRSPETILQTARQFPKLRSVFLIVSKNLLNVLGNALSSLEEAELAFYRSDNMDSILTGLSSEEVDAFKGLPANQLDEVKRSKEPVHFLKNLKKLRLYNMDSVEPSLSDFGCRFALLKLEHLKVLELKGNFSQISDQVMERMRKKFVVRQENSEN